MEFGFHKNRRIRFDIAKHIVNTMGRFQPDQKMNMIRNAANGKGNAFEALYDCTKIGV